MSNSPVSFFFFIYSYTFSPSPNSILIYIWFWHLSFHLTIWILLYIRIYIFYLKKILHSIPWHYLEHLTVFSIWCYCKMPRAIHLCLYFLLVGYNPGIEIVELRNVYIKTLNEYCHFIFPKSCIFLHVVYLEKL